MTDAARGWQRAPRRLGTVHRVLSAFTAARRALERHDRLFDALRLEALGNSAVVREAGAGRFVVLSSSAAADYAPYSLARLIRGRLRDLAARASGEPGDHAAENVGDYFPMLVDTDVVTRLRLPIDDWLDRRLLTPSESLADTYVLLPQGAAAVDRGALPLKVRHLAKAR